MFSGSGIRFELESGRTGGPGLAVVLSKPFQNSGMDCWTCEIRLEADVVHVRSIHGATSLQALGLAAGITPSLIQSLFPDEAFTEDGMPVLLPPEVWPDA